jgi:hypothetical protein
VYKPPLRGAPKTRVGGGTRGPGDQLPALYVLAPEHTGLTTRGQPILYWYLSKPASARIEVTLADDRSVQPLLEAVVTGITKPGMQQLKLADYGARLQPGVEYRWSIALVRDPDQRSQDIVASAGVRLVEPDEDLRTWAGQCREMECVSLYAEKGVWYDALDTLEGLIETRPNNQVFQTARKQLMEQAQLPTSK